MVMGGSLFIKDTLILILGLALLFFGSHWLVKSLKGIAVYFKLKPLFLSLIVLGFVSSSPELFVTLNAGIKGLPAAALGNVLGSNIVNILLILGLSGLFFGFSQKEPQIIRFDMPCLILGVMLLGLRVIDKSLGFLDACLFLIIFFVYVVLAFRQRQNDQVNQQPLGPDFQIVKSSAFLITGFIVLFLGASISVDSAINLVKAFSLSEKMAGVFILSLSTSLPEMASILQAGFKKEGEIALGGVIGSNIFNTLFVLGVAGLIQPLSFAGLYYDYFFMAGVSAALFLCLLFFKEIPKIIFIIFICFYFIYVVFLFNN